MTISTINNRKKTYKIIVLVFWIAVWEIAALIINKEIYLPTPFKTFQVLISLIVLDTFWYTIFSTISRVIIGFVISCIIGCITGILCSFNDFLYRLFHPLIVAVKSTPVMSFILIALIWFQSGHVPTFICFLMCFPIIWTSAVEGMTQVDTQLLEMSTVFKVKRRYVLRHIYLPSLMPFLTTAMITSLGLGWKVTVAAEVLSNPLHSIGGFLYDSKVYLESAELYAWTIVVILLSLVFEYIIKYAIRKLRFKK